MGTPRAAAAAAAAGLPERDSVAALAATACRLGQFADCRVLAREDEFLVEQPVRPDGLRLPVTESFAGACLSTGRAQMAQVNEDILHPRERALLTENGATYCLVVPVVPIEGEPADGVVVGLKASPLGSGVGEDSRAALSLAAEQLALRHRVKALQATVLAERARSRQLEGAAEGILHSLRAAAMVLAADLTVHDANRAAEVLLDFQLPRARGKPVREVLTQPAIIEVLESIEATGGGSLPEVRLGQQQEVVVEIRISPVFDARGDLRWRVVVFNDTTVLRQADELKNEFISMVSHELRTPLTSIKAFAATLLRDERASADDQQEWLRIIDRECDRLTALVNDLLAISRLDSGRALGMQWSEVDLMPVLHDVAAGQQATARKHQVQVLGPQSVMLEADAAKVRQIFNNLINNAIKYSPRGGGVTVTAEETEKDVRILVKDQGVGIRPEHLNLVFEKFFQVDGSTTRRVGGSGLGLYLTRRLVEAHDGQVWAESELGRGTTLVVVLPKRRADEAES